MADAEGEDSKPPKVGKGNPPKATRFKPGQCGNPKGRPKGSKNISTVVREELNTKISVTEEGRRKRISKAAAVAKQLVNKAVAGDPKATATLLTDDRAREQKLAAGGGGASDDALQRPEDTLTMESIVARIRATSPEEKPANRAEEITATTSEPQRRKRKPFPEGQRS